MAILGWTCPANGQTVNRNLAKAWTPRRVARPFKRDEKHRDAKTQRHRQGRHQEDLVAGLVCASVSLCLCVFHIRSYLSQVCESFSARPHSSTLTSHTCLDRAGSCDAG